MRHGPGSHPLITTLIAAGTALLLLLLLAAQIQSDQRAARHSLEVRYIQRTALAQQFVDDYTSDLLRSIRRHGEVALNGPDPSEESFDQVVQELHGTSAVLVAADGQIMQSVPESRGADEEAISRFPSLVEALDGRADTIALLGVRNGTEPPELGFVVHFEGPAGRRVLAIGIDSKDTTLRSFFRNLSPIAGHQSFLVDEAGTIISSNSETRATTLSAALPGLDTALRDSSGKVRVGGEERFFTTRPLTQTTWRIVSTAPSKALYAPLHETRWSPWFLFAFFVLVAALGVAVLQRVLRERTVAAHSALVDKLTGIANRRQLELALSETRRHGPGPWGVFMIDIDHFKAVNDRFGHATGDDILREVAEALRTSSRPEDVVGRWGGEEFLVIVRDAGNTRSASLAERLRRAVAELEGLACGPITISVGYATTESTQPAEILQRADEALYLAKQRGRNQVAAAVATTTGGDPSSP